MNLKLSVFRCSGELDLVLVMLCHKIEPILVNFGSKELETNHFGLWGRFQFWFKVFFPTWANSSLFSWYVTSMLVAKNKLHQFIHFLIFSTKIKKPYPRLLFLISLGFIKMRCVIRNNFFVSHL